VQKVLRIELAGTGSHEAFGLSLFHGAYNHGRLAEIAAAQGLGWVCAGQSGDQLVLAGGLRGDRHDLAGGRGLDQGGVGCASGEDSDTDRDGREDGGTRGHTPSGFSGACGVTRLRHELSVRLEQSDLHRPTGMPPNDLLLPALI